MEIDMIIDLEKLPKGKTYEHEYNGWLKIFKKVAESKTGSITIKHPPLSWTSLLYYLGANIEYAIPHFEEDKLLFGSFTKEDIYSSENRGRLREMVEMHSASRPELVDALYKSDMQWKTIGRIHQYQIEFKVTCNGSFFRPEVLEYLDELKKFVPKKRKCILVPCAADKPYPAPLHKAVKEIIPDDYELIIATGVLGLVPESLWGIMPTYDSGLPNELRLSQVCREYFGRNYYEHIVIYCDFYSDAIARGLPVKYMCDLSKVKFVNEVKYYEEYLPLLSKKYLNKLRRVEWKGNRDVEIEGAEEC